jgi:RimJ/RimL family protein N-acetyltransferase
MLIGHTLSLEPITLDHAALLAEWHADPDYHGPFTNVWPSARQELERRLTGVPDSRDEGRFLMRRCADDELVGVVGYFNPFTLSSFFKGVEIGYQVHPRFRRRGYARQAACLLVNHLFDALPLERIQATMVVDNAISCRVAEEAGLRRDGLYRRVTFLHGRWTDVYLYSIVRDDWVDEASYRAGRPPF